MIAYWLLFGLFAAGAFGLQNNLQRAAYAGAMPPPGAQLPLPPKYQMLTLASILGAMMIGLRYEVGSDWHVYVDIFERIDAYGLRYALTSIDPGYGLLNWIATAAGLEIWLVNVMCGLLLMFGLVTFAKLQPDPWLAVAVAIPYLVIVVGMGYSRQAVAIGLCMVGLAGIATNGSFPRFMMWVFLGALFHRSAVILIPIVAIAYSRNRFQSVAIGVVGCAVGYFILNQGQGLDHFQRGYITTARESQGAGIRLAMNLPPALIFLGFARRFARNQTELRIWLVFSLIALLSFVAWTLVAATTAVDRMALYIIPLQILVLSRLPSVLAGPGRSSGFLVTVVVLYSAFVEYVWLNYSNNAPQWLPYRLYPLV